MPKIYIKGIDTLLWILLLLCAACGNPNNQYTYEREGLPDSLLPLYNEILTIHDEVMPEMTTISGYQNAITEEIKHLKSDTNKMAMVRNLNMILGDLNKAEDAMMTWMHNFSKLDSISDLEKEIFLENEKMSATEMRNLVLRTLQSAKDYLENE